MSIVYVTSDWHLGHSGITRFRTQFPDELTHSQYILDRAKKILKKRDVLLCLGDMCFTEDRLEMFKELPCRLILVPGNHDGLKAEKYLRVFDDVSGPMNYKGYWLTHIPIHRQELYRRHNIHGHCHRGGPWETNKEPEYYNAILEFNDYAPVKFQDIVKIMKERN